MTTETTGLEWRKQTAGVWHAGVGEYRLACWDSFIGGFGWSVRLKGTWDDIDKGMAGTMDRAREAAKAAVEEVIRG